MQNNATQIAERGIAAIQSAENTQALELIKAQYLGKTGELNALLKQLGALSVEEKKTVGAHINECKTRFQAAFGVDKVHNGFGQRGFAAATFADYA